MTCVHARINIYVTACGYPIHLLSSSETTDQWPQTTCSECQKSKLAKYWILLQPKKDKNPFPKGTVTPKDLVNDDAEVDWW